MRNISILVVVLAFILLQGCQEQDLSRANSDARKNRLIASENIQFKEDLKKCQKQIEEQKKLIEQCQQEKDSLVQKAQEETESLVQFVMEESKQLSEENAALKAEIESLKK